MKSSTNAVTCNHHNMWEKKSEKEEEKHTTHHDKVSKIDNKNGCRDKHAPLWDQVFVQQNNQSKSDGASKTAIRQNELIYAIKLDNTMTICKYAEENDTFTTKNTSKLTNWCIKSTLCLSFTKIYYETRKDHKRNCGTKAADVLTNFLTGKL